MQQKDFVINVLMEKLLESDLRGNLWAYVTSNKVSWTKEEAENELKDLEVGNGTDIRTN